MKDVFYLLSEMPAILWILITLDTIYTLRKVTFDMLVGSFPGGYTTCKKKAVDIRKQQNLISRIRMNYIDGFVSDDFRKPYKKYLVATVLYGAFIFVSLLLLIVMKLYALNCAQKIKGIFFCITIFIWLAVSLIPYDPINRITRKLRNKYSGI